MSRPWKLVLGAALAAIVVIDFVLLAGYDGTRGFFAAFGFLGTVLIVVFSKAAGKLLLNRRDDYYERVRSHD